MKPCDRISVQPWRKIITEKFKIDNFLFVIISIQIE